MEIIFSEAPRDTEETVAFLPARGRSVEHIHSRHCGPAVDEANGHGMIQYFPSKTIGRE